MYLELPQCLINDLRELAAHHQRIQQLAVQITGAHKNELYQRALELKGQCA